MCLRCLLHHILSLIAYTFRENRQFVFNIIVQFMMSANGRICFVCTVHHLIIIIVQNYLKTLNVWNACQMNFVECVSKITHILSVIRCTIHYTICGAVCFQFTHSSCDDWDNIYTLSYYHHQIGRMNYYPLFRVRSWNNGVRCMSCYIVMNRDSHLRIDGDADYGTASTYSATNINLDMVSRSAYSAIVFLWNTFL